MRIGVGALAAVGNGVYFVAAEGAVLDRAAGFGVGPRRHLQRLFRPLDDGSLEFGRACGRRAADDFDDGLSGNLAGWIQFLKAHHVGGRGTRGEDAGGVGKQGERRQHRVPFRGARLLRGLRQDPLCFHPQCGNGLGHLLEGDVDALVHHALGHGAIRGIHIEPLDGHGQKQVLGSLRVVAIETTEVHHHVGGCAGAHGHDVDAIDIHQQHLVAVHVTGDNVFGSRAGGGHSPGPFVYEVRVGLHEFKSLGFRPIAALAAHGSRQDRPVARMWLGRRGVLARGLGGRLVIGVGSRFTLGDRLGFVSWLRFLLGRVLGRGLGSGLRCGS